MKLPAKETVERLRRQYPEGTRIELIRMDDPYNKKLVPGCKGSVQFVDSAGTLQMRWDCGSSLGLIPGEDDFRIITDEEDREDE